MPKLGESGLAFAMLGMLAGSLLPPPALGQGANPVENCLMAGAALPDAVIRECTLAMQSSDKAAIPAVYLGRADAYVRKGDYDRALADYDEAIKLAPGTAIAFALRGEVHAKRGDYDGAIADYERAIEREPNLPSAFSNRAWPGQTRASSASPSPIIRKRSSSI